MAIYDINGNAISMGGGSDFFNITYPSYTNIFDGEYDAGTIIANYSPGAKSENSAQARMTTRNFIPVVAGKYLYVQKPSAWTEDRNGRYPTSQSFVSCRVNFYRSKETTSESYISTSNISAPVLIPNGANYALVSYYDPYTPSMENLFIGLADDDSASLLEWEAYYPSGSIKSAYINSANLKPGDLPLPNGKTWVLFGDSLTDSYGGHDWAQSTSSVGGDGWKTASGNVPWTGYFFASKIAREFNLTLDNRGKSGSNMCISTDNYAAVSGVYVLDAFTAEIDAGTTEQPEYITIAFGSNCYDTYVGSSTDTSSDTTKSYYGAAKYFIEQIREHCPNTVFGFVIPPACSWAGTSAAKETGVPLARMAIKTVCEEYGVPYIDMEAESGITVDMLPDGVHISSRQANNLYYHAMRRFVMGL